MRGGGNAFWEKERRLAAAGGSSVYWKECGLTASHEETLGNVDEVGVMNLSLWAERLFNDCADL